MKFLNRKSILFYSLIKVNMENESIIKSQKRLIKIAAISDTHGRNQEINKLIENN